MSQLDCIYETLARYRPSARTLWVGDRTRIDKCVATVLIVIAWTGVAVLFGQSSIMHQHTNQFGATVFCLISATLVLGGAILIGALPSPNPSDPLPWQFVKRSTEQCFALRGFFMPVSPHQAEQLVEWTTADPELESIAVQWLVGREPAMFSTSEFRLLKKASVRINAIRAAEKRKDVARASLAQAQFTLDQAGISAHARTLTQAKQLDKIAGQIPVGAPSKPAARL